MSSLPGDTPTWVVFRLPAFRWFVLSRAVAVLSMQVLSVAVGWQVYDLTGDPGMLGLVGLVQFVPQLLLFPLTGTVVDRSDRRRVLNAVYVILLLAAALLATWAHLGVHEATPVLATLLLLAVGRSLSGPAAQATLPRLIPDGLLRPAVAWNSSIFTSALSVGPALGGFLYAGLGPTQTYLAAAVGFSVSLVASLFLPEVRAPGTSRRGTLGEAVEGIRFIFRQPILLGAISLDLFAVLLGGAVALLPVYARDILHAGPTALGWLRAAPAIGAAMTAIALAVRPISRHVGATLYVAVAVFGLGTIVFGLSESFWLSFAALVLTGIADEVSVFIRVTVVQLATPDHVRGRVSAAEFVFISASNELGELESGYTARWFGPVAAVVGGGIGSLAAVLIGALASPRLRRVDRFEEVRSP